MLTSKAGQAAGAEDARLLIVAGRYYEAIVDTLIAGAERAIAAAGAHVEIIDVPGAFEIPAAILAVHEAGAHGRTAPYDGFIALGCVIRGETSHYDYVCGETARALMDLSLRPGLSIGFGVLTVENEAQAQARAALDSGDKGGEAARAALAQIALKRRFAVSRV